MSSRPNVPTTTSPSGQPSTTEYVPHTRLALTEQQLLGSNGQLSGAAICRVIGLVQDNAIAATKATRSDPTLIKKIAQGVVLQTGSSTVQTTSVGVVDFNGSPNGVYQVLVVITTGGNLGTAAFDWSIDNGTTWVAKNVPVEAIGGVVGAVILPLGTIGLWVRFPNNSYSLGDTFTAVTTMSPVNIRHGLGQPAAGYRCISATAGSMPFAATRAANNGNVDPTQFLSLIPGSCGTYDIEIF